MEENTTSINSNDMVLEESNNQDYSFDATDSSGEDALGSYIIKSSQAIEKVIPGPGKVLGSGFKTTFKSFIGNFKQPLKLIPIFVIITIWIVISILESAGNISTPVRVISFLTFASGGTHGGFIGAVGGIFGKGLFAGAIVYFISFFKKKDKENKMSGKEKFKTLFVFSGKSIWGYLTGIGIAMFFFLFIAGGATRISFMGGMAVCLLAFGSNINKGFLYQFISSLFSKGKTQPSPNVSGIMQGLSIGLLAASLLGLININLILIILGAILVIGGIVMMIVQASSAKKQGKEEAK